MAGVSSPCNIFTLNTTADTVYKALSNGIVKGYNVSTFIYCLSSIKEFY